MSAPYEAPEPVRKAEGWVDEHTERPGGRPKGLEDVAGTPRVEDR